MQITGLHGNPYQYTVEQWQNVTNGNDNTRDSATSIVTNSFPQRTKW